MSDLRVGRTKPLRVLYVEANEDGTVGGSHQALFDLARGLPRNQVDPVVLFYQDNSFSDRLRAEGIRVILFDDVRSIERAANRSSSVFRRRATQLMAVVRRVKLLAHEGIELLHLNNGPTVGVDDWLPAALMLRTPCVVNASGLPVPERRQIGRMLARHFSRIVAISRYMAGTLADQGVEPRRVVTISPPVDIDGLRERVNVTRLEMRARLGVPADNVVITMVGNVRHWKGQHVLMAALGELPRSALMSLTVLIVGAVSVGDADYVKKLEEQIAANGLIHVVKLIGARNDVPNILAASDIAIHASVLPEPFGLVVVEAMALGLAVIASRSGGPSEIIGEGSGAGMLFDPESPLELTSCIARLISDAALRQALGDSARLRAASFDLPAHVQAVLGLYQEIT